MRELKGTPLNYDLLAVKQGLQSNQSVKPTDHENSSAIGQSVKRALNVNKATHSKHVKSVNKVVSIAKKSANYSLRRRSKRIISKIKQQEDEDYFTPPSTPNRNPIDCLQHISKTTEMSTVDDTGIKAVGANFQPPNTTENVRLELQQMIQKVDMDSDKNATDVISVKAVMSMFKKVEQMLQPVTAQPSLASMEKIETKIDAVEKKSATVGEVSSLKKELIHQKFLNRVQGGSIQRLNDIIQELTGRLDNIELNNNKRSITLTNLPVDKESDLAIAQVKTFFSETIGISPDIEDIFFIGNAEPQTMVITFQSLQEKKYVMQNKTSLKGYTTGGKPHFLNEYLPTAINEKRRRDREISSMFPQDAVTFNRGKMQIQGVYYKPKVTPPAHDEMINLSLAELDRVLAITIPNGDMFVKDNNEFTDYTIPVENIQQIKDAYLKLRILHPRARHIMCGYVIDNIDDPDNKNFCDDDEIGGGRILLETLELNNITNRVLFVIRYYGDNKIGQDRFTCIRNAAISAIQKSPEKPHSGHCSERV